MLQRETIEAVNARRIPPALQEDTLAAVTELTESIECGGSRTPVRPIEAERLAERLRSLGG